MIEFSLTAFEVSFLAIAAERRTVVKQAYHVRNHRCQHKSDFATHLTGVLGEYAVGKLLGSKLDTSVHIGGDGGSDMEIEGYTLQIKTRNRQPEPIYLYVNSPADLRADIIVLAIAHTLTEVRVIGWMQKMEFLAAAKPMNFGYGERIGVNAKELHPAETLGEWLRDNSRQVAEW